MASYIETTPERTITVSVGFMTSLPEIGHLEFVVQYSTDVCPTQQEVLTAITDQTLIFLGGHQQDWIITNHSAALDGFDVFTYSYSFECLFLNNRERANPVMRTSTFRPHIHRFAIYM